MGTILFERIGAFDRNGKKLFGEPLRDVTQSRREGMCVEQQDGSAIFLTFLPKLIETLGGKLQIPALFGPGFG